MRGKMSYFYVLVKTLRDIVPVPLQEGQRDKQKGHVSMLPLGPQDVTVVFVSGVRNSRINEGGRPCLLVNNLLEKL